MPIYAYKCASCGHAKDVLQKMSDAPLSVCPACGAATFTKQLTAAGFQLKGSGWYATDFKGGSGPAPAAGGEAGKGDGEAGKSAEPAKPATDGAAKGGSDSTPAPASAPAPAPGPASGKSDAPKAADVRDRGPARSGH